jgi:hypothetical protein
VIVSFWSYVVFFLGVVLAGLGLLLIFSLLAMAQKGDEYQDQLEFALSQRQDLAPSLTDPGKSENIGSPPKSVPGQVGVSQPGMLLGR